jgi:uncharacterized damage-inducible protein DinB
MIDEILELFAYNRWANERMLDATAALSQEELTRDLGGSFPSLRATLTHMLGAEWVWLARWKGVSPTGLPDAWDLSTHDAIRDRWRAIEQEQAAFLETLTDESIRRVVDYRLLSGAAFSNPLWQLLRHVVNHASYHRGQVTTLLRQLGRPAVSTDLIVFHRERARPEPPQPAA